MFASGSSWRGTEPQRSESLRVVARNIKLPPIPDAPTFAPSPSPVPILNPVHSAEDQKKMLQTIFGQLMDTSRECSEVAQRYYNSKFDELSSLERTCKMNAFACKDLDALQKKVRGAWAGTDCPGEMPRSCTMWKAPACYLPGKICAPKACHSINLVKAIAQSFNCTEAAMECDGGDKIFFKHQEAKHQEANTYEQTPWTTDQVVYLCIVGFLNFYMFVVMPIYACYLWGCCR